MGACVGYGGFQSLCLSEVRAVENVGSRSSRLRVSVPLDRCCGFCNNRLFTHTVGAMAAPALAGSTVISSGVIHRRVSTVWGI